MNTHSHALSITTCCLSLLLFVSLKHTYKYAHTTYSCSISSQRVVVVITVLYRFVVILCVDTVEMGD